MAHFVSLSSIVDGLVWIWTIFNLVNHGSFILRLSLGQLSLGQLSLGQLFLGIPELGLIWGAWGGWGELGRLLHAWLGSGSLLVVGYCPASSSLRSSDFRSSSSPASRWTFSISSAMRPISRPMKSCCLACRPGCWSTCWSLSV